MTSSSAVDLVISFDTTSSMHTVLEAARRDLGLILRCLFKAGTDLRVGLILHGDYGDEYETRLYQPTESINQLVKFLKEAPNTCGQDYPECYELVLHQAATKVHWRKQPGVSRLLVLLGDAVPHELNSKRNKYHLDWRNEARVLASMNVSVYCVDCGGVGTGFYRFAQELSSICNGAAVPYRGIRELRHLLKQLLLLLQQQPTQRTIAHNSIERRYKSYHCNSQRAENSPTTTCCFAEPEQKSSVKANLGKCVPQSMTTPNEVVLALARSGTVAIGKTMHLGAKLLINLTLLFLLYSVYVTACF